MTPEAFHGAALAPPDADLPAYLAQAHATVAASLTRKARAALRIS